MSNIHTITDFGRPELELYSKLTEAQLLHYYEPNGGIFIAESPMIIERALRAGCEAVSFLMDEKCVEGIGKAFVEQCPDVPVYVGKTELLSSLTGFPLTRGALCAMRRPKNRSAEEVCEGARRIVILENVMNPTNVGAIFRSAAALNMDGILLTAGCSDPLYRRAARVSMGTVFQIPWSILSPKMWPSEAVDKLRAMGFKTVAMALREDTVSISDERLHQEEKLAIVLGTEGEGLANETIADCDYTVKIPMSHGVDSLNVAAASAVAFWELGK